MALKKNETVELKNALFSSSEFSLEVFDFVWKLRNFKGTFSKDIASPSFVAPTTKNEWRLKIRMASDFVSVGLELVGFENGEKKERENCDWIKTEYQITILDSDEKIAASAGPFDYNEPIYFCQMISRSACSNRAKRYFSDGNILTFHCRISTNHITHDPNPAEKVEKEEQLEKTTSNHFVDFVTGQLKSFFISGEFSDVTIKTKKNSFPASKIILAAQSPVFKSIFNSDFKENELKIEEFSDDAVKGLFEFVYTGQSKSVEENPVELLKMSREFELAHLKSECEKVLMDDLKVENAVEIFILAHFCDSSALKTRKLADFMSRWRKQVERTADFEDMKKDYPEVLLELYTQLD